MTTDARDPSDALAPDMVRPTEGQRAVRATLLGAALGAILAMLSRRRGAGHGSR